MTTIFAFSSELGCSTFPAIYRRLARVEYVVGQPCLKKRYDAYRTMATTCDGLTKPYVSLNLRRFCEAPHSKIIF